MSTATNTLTKTRKVKRGIKARRIPRIVVVGIIGFMILLALLFIQLYEIRLNKEVSALKTQLEQVTAANDSKKGQLVSNVDLAAIESQARALGMTEIQSTQYVYEGSAKKSLVKTSDEVGLFTFLDFFKQIRNEGKWPRGLEEKAE